MAPSKIRLLWPGPDGHGCFFFRRAKAPVSANGRDHRLAVAPFERGRHGQTIELALSGPASIGQVAQSIQNETVEMVKAVLAEERPVLVDDQPALGIAKRM